MPVAQAIGLSPRAGGGCSVKPAALAQHLRRDPAGVLALVTGHARKRAACRANALL